MNPYVTRMLELLGDEDPILVLEATPVQLEALFLNLGDDLGRPYAPGKWNARQVLAHRPTTNSRPVSGCGRL